METRMRLLIADDRSRSRQGLKALLSTQPGIEVVAEAGDGREAVRLVDERRPDAVLMDAKMPAMNGMAATRVIKARWPQTKVIILTMYEIYRDEALDSGANAFLVKGCSAEELLATILDAEEKAR